MRIHRDSRPALRTGRLAAALVLLSTLIVMAACGEDDKTPLPPTATPTPTPTSATTTTPAPPNEVDVTAAASGTSVELANGGILVVRLVSNPTTGYDWTVDQIDSTKLQQGQSDYIPDDTSGQLVGSGGTTVLRFTALQPGTTQLRLVYTRSFETGVEPADTFEVTLEIQ